MINIFYVAVTRAQERPTHSEGTDSAQAVRLALASDLHNGSHLDGLIWMVQKGEGPQQGRHRGRQPIQQPSGGFAQTPILRASKRFACNISTQQDGILAILGNSWFRTADLLLYSQGDHMKMSSDNHHALEIAGRHYSTWHCERALPSSTTRRRTCGCTDPMFVKSSRTPRR